MSTGAADISFCRRGLLRAGLATALIATGRPLMAKPAAAAALRRIDVHNHYLPKIYLEKAEVILRREYGLRWPPKTWDVQTALAAMDENGIATSIVSLSSPGVWLGSAEESRSLARECNEYAAKVVTDHPSRFGHFASLPLPDVPGALAEIDHAADTLHADGFIVNSCHGGAWLGDARFRPVYEALNARRAVVLVHPLPQDQFRNLQADVPFSTLEYPFDTTRAIVNWIVTGSVTAFPNIRLIFPHGGGPTAMLIDRIRALPRINPRIAERVPGGVDAALRSFFYDTAAIANPSGISALRALVPASQILFGTDTPLQPTQRIIAELEKVLGESPDRIMIERENALRLLPRLAAAN